MRRLTFMLLSLVLVAGCTTEVDNPDATLEGTRATDAIETSAPAAPAAFEDLVAYARSERLHERPLGEIMQTIGLRLEGKPYVAGILDAPGEEKLVCRLDGFDCVTFVETTLALARGIAEQDYSYETFQENVRDQRYRGGEMDGYCSRIHYFSEWIADNEARGTVENITAELGGVPLDKNINFMSTHRASYPRFAENDALYECIQEMEASLQDLDLYYIPEDAIRTVYDELQAGDIVATATNIKGLDVTHTGLVYDNGDGTKGLLHASTSGGVKVSPDLQQYIQGNKNQIGIIVARPKG